MRWLIANFFWLVLTAAVLGAVTGKYESYLTGLTGLFVLTFSLLCVGHGLAFRRSLRLCKNVSAPVVPQLVKLDTIRQIGAVGHGSPALTAVTYYNGAFCLILLAMWRWWHYLPLLLLAVWKLVGIADYYLNRFMPPVVLYLSASSPSSHKLWDTLMQSYDPLKVVSLLDIATRASAGKWFDWEADFRVSVNSYRLNLGTPWIPVAEFFMQAIPTIILDARTTSTALELETEILLKNGYLNRLVIVDGDGVARTTFGAMLWGQLPESERWRCVSESVLTDFLKSQRRSLDADSLANQLYAKSPAQYYDGLGFGCPGKR
jgi:hypothetical protein